MKILLLLVNFISIWIYVMAIRHKKAHKHYRDDNNDTQEFPTFPDTGGTMHLDLNGELRKLLFVLCAESKPDSNTLCSPLSAILPLGKLALGAEGESLNELLHAIGVPKKSKISDYYKPILTYLRYLPGVKLDIISRLYVSESARLNGAFQDAAIDVFESSASKIDFTFPTYASEEINSWVSSQTHGLIKDILEPADIPPTTSLILVNAVYFNGRWTEPFDKVTNVTFHTLTSHKTVQMMTRTGDFNYTVSEALGSKIISIPYDGGRASMVVVLPGARTGLLPLLQALRLAPDALQATLAAMKPTSVRLMLPKFTVTADLNLGLMYQKLGLKTVFSAQESGLRKIIRDETVYITSAKHKCYIDVNEYGTEAAASSASVMVKLSPISSVEFRADHPFLYFIIVNDQQLFSGTFVDPESK